MVCRLSLVGYLFFHTLWPYIWVMLINFKPRFQTPAKKVVWFCDAFWSGDAVECSTWNSFKGCAMHRSVSLLNIDLSNPNVCVSLRPTGCTANGAPIDELLRAVRAAVSLYPELLYPELLYSELLDCCDFTLS